MRRQEGEDSKCGEPKRATGRLTHLDFDGRKFPGALFEAPVLELHLSNGLPVLRGRQLALAEKKRFLVVAHPGSEVAACLADLCEYAQRRSDFGQSCSSDGNRDGSGQKEHVDSAIFLDFFPTPLSA